MSTLAYSNGTTTTYGPPTVYSVSKTGDGIKEVHVSSNLGWFGDYSVFAYSAAPFFVRGDYYGDGTIAGVFSSGSGYGGGSGASGTSASFRVVLCPVAL